MKNRFFLTSPQVLMRGAIVMAVTALTVYIFLGPILSELIDNMYRQSGLQRWQNLFYFLSGNRVVLTCFGCISVFIIASGWIFRPMFSENCVMYAGLIKENINLQKGSIDDSQIQLPKHMKAFEDVLNSVNAEIRLSRYAAKEAEQRKDDLVAYLAHDMRTPLTSVLGYLELLIENQDLPETQRKKFMDSALRKANRMQSLIEELFEVTRYSITHIELEKSPVNLNMMINQLVEEMYPVVEQRGIEIEVSLEEIPMAFIDPDKTARSLDNVFNNAAYYTPPGGKVTITLDSDGDFSRIRISNTGSEIPPEKLARFFEKFYRGEDARRSETGGSGLGLAIAKNIIEAHGGSITVENRDKTTTFTILI